MGTFSLAQIRTHVAITFMDTVLCKRRHIEDSDSDDTTPLQQLKDFLHRTVSPTKRRRLAGPEDAPLVMPLDIEELASPKKPAQSPQAFITSSPKPPKCASPQLSFRARDLRQKKITEARANKENSLAVNVAAPIPRSASLTGVSTATSTLFSPHFKKRPVRSMTLGSLQLMDMQDRIFPSEEELLEPTATVSLRTDELLDDLSGSEDEDEVTIDLSGEFELFPSESEESELSLSLSSPEESSIVESSIELDYDAESLLFIRDVGPIPSDYLNRKPHLPPKRPDAPKITLVLDLDETLVHCETSYLENADYKFPVPFDNRVFQVWGRKRPQVDRFLARVAQLFEVVVFTASQQVYADYILDELDTNGVIDHKLFRDSCVCTSNFNYLKDLNVLGRDLSKVVIIDNAITSFAYQVDNGIPILSWYDDEADNELTDLLPFLEALSQVDDVRPYIRDAFAIQKQIDSLEVSQPTSV